jgi:hypothetical protein
MTTLAVPYYGNLYHTSKGYEHVYFIVSYDTTTESPQEISLQVWDEKQTPELVAWLKENGVFGIVCSDSESLPLIEKFANKGITVLGLESRCTQGIMKNLKI